MPSVSIAVHYGEPVTFETADALTVDAIRVALGPERSHLVPAHDLAATLRAAGRKHWAAVLDHEEEAHMVTVAFSP